MDGLYVVDVCFYVFDELFVCVIGGSNFLLCEILGVCMIDLLFLRENDMKVIVLFVVMVGVLLSVMFVGCVVYFGFVEVMIGWYGDCDWDGNCYWECCDWEVWYVGLCDDCDCCDD